jgi:hypothetical protein
MGMKMEKNGMMGVGQVVRYDITLSPKNTQSAPMYIKTTVFPSNPLKRKI